jgi:hypothetical protein
VVTLYTNKIFHADNLRSAHGGHLCVMFLCVMYLCIYVLYICVLCIYELCFSERQRLKVVFPFREESRLKFKFNASALLQTNVQSLPP